METIIKESNSTGINLYKVTVNDDKLMELRDSEFKFMRDKRLVKHYELYSSCGDSDKFRKFMDYSYHDQWDFYFNQGWNSGSNDYIVIRDLTKNGSKKNYFKKSIIPKTFEVKLNKSYNGDTIKFNPKLASQDGRIFYAILNNGLNYGGNHTSVGYHNDSLVQITPNLYYIYKVLERKFSFIDDAIERNYEINQLLSIINSEFIAFYDLKTIEAINLSENAPQLIKSINNK